MSKMRDFCLVSFAFAALLLSASCEKEVTEVMSDCGFSMSYEKVADGKQAELVFSEVTVEVLGGHRNCGFGYIPRKVENAVANGIKLEGNQRADKYVYLAPPNFDPKKGVSIDYQSRSYILTPESYKEVGGTVFVSLRRFPPK